MRDGKIMVVAWKEENCAEPANWYKVDEKGEGNRFFQNLMDNAEIDGNELALLFVTPEEWAEADRIGKEMA